MLIGKSSRHITSKRVGKRIDNGIFHAAETDLQAARRAKFG